MREALSGERQRVVEAIAPQEDARHLRGEIGLATALVRL